MELNYDYIKDDICYNCKYSKMKQEGKYGTFSRRFGCCHPAVLDFKRRAQYAVTAIEQEEYQSACGILNTVIEDKDNYERYGWVEPKNSTVCLKREENEDGKYNNHVNQTRKKL